MTFLKLESPDTHRKACGAVFGLKPSDIPAPSSQESLAGAVYERLATLVNILMNRKTN